jgi:hypothetical protein
MARKRFGVVWGGLVLIALGLALLLAQWIGWEGIWPIFPLLGGLAFYAGYLSTGLRDSGLAFVGTGAVLVGLFFFGFTLGPWEWTDMARLWPGFAIILGIAFFSLFLAERPRDIGTLSVGCAALIVGVVGLAVTNGFVGSEIVRLWPLLLVLIGIMGLIGALLRMVRKA